MWNCTISEIHCGVLRVKGSRCDTRGERLEFRYGEILPPDPWKYLRFWLAATIQIWSLVSCLAKESEFEAPLFQIRRTATIRV